MTDVTIEKSRRGTVVLGLFPSKEALKTSTLETNACIVAKQPEL